MKMSFKLFFTTLISLAITSCIGGGNGSSSASNRGDIIKEAKYIFYFIGDGMATSQVRLAEAALTTQTFKDNYAKQTNSESQIDVLNIKSLNITGLATTNAENRYITDSAAAGTALATGYKTDVGIISQSPDGTTFKTIAEMAKEKGMKVGIVSSVSIDHATPACFYAHTSSRSQYADISDQLLISGFDYFGGGSVKWSARVDDDNIDMAEAYASYRKEAEAIGFKYITTKAEFDTIGAGERQPIIATLDMLANEQYSADGSALPYTIDLSKQSSDDNKITLAQFTAKGVELLNNEDGFFMMVEGGKIDWACHANDAATCAYEVVAFDEAIGVAVDFAKIHPDETLIVVTGDHDCGGLTIGFAGTGYDSAFEILAGSKISYNEFAIAATNKIAAGESFERLLSYACDEYGFTYDIKDGSDGVITTTVELSDYEVRKLRSAYMKSSKQIEFDDSDLYRAAYSGYDPFTTTCMHILNNKSGIDFTSYSHTGVPVMVFASGVNDELFSGYYDNTDIAKKIMLAAGLE